MTEIDPQYVICQKSSLTRLHQRVQEINAAVEPTRFTKKIGDQLVECERASKAITGSVEATAERLIKDYVSDYHRLLRRLGPQATFEKGMPSLMTSRVTLASRRTISEKTAYNHLRKLRELGFITKYKFRGSKHAFEIWIDPALLFQPERTYPQPVVDSTPAPSFSPAQTSFSGASTANFTAYKVTVNQGDLETEKKEVGNVHGDAQERQHGDKNHGNTERRQPETASKWQTETTTDPFHGNQAPGGAAGAAEGGNVDKSNSAGSRAKRKLTRAGLEESRASQRSQAQHQAILEGYLLSFWNYARQLLYPARPFQPYEEALILNTIRQSVYKDFGPQLTDKEWDNYQDELYRRLELAESYYAKHPDKYVPAPYAQFKPGTGYFDEQNTRGFAGTEAWFLENRRNYRKNYITQRINLAVRQLQHHQVGKAPKTLQRLSYIEAYRELDKSVGRYGAQAQAHFRNLVATIGNQKPKLVIGFTRNVKK